MTFDEFFKGRVRRKGECLIWIKAINNRGYGTARFNGPVVYAHRIAFILGHGYNPEGHILHSCDNPLCCNPKHLSEGTHQKNMKERSQRNRHRSPRPGNGRAKISEEDRESIIARYQAGETNKSALAREFGVTPPRIRQIVQ